MSRHQWHKPGVHSRLCCTSLLDGEVKVDEAHSAWTEVRQAEWPVSGPVWWEQALASNREYAYSEVERP